MGRQNLDNMSADTRACWRLENGSCCETLSRVGTVLADVVGHFFDGNLCAALLSKNSLLRKMAVELGAKVEVTDGSNGALSIQYVCAIRWDGFLMLGRSSLAAAAGIPAHVLNM